MRPSLRTSRHGGSFTVALTGPLDQRIASSHFSRLLASNSKADELILDVTDVDSIHDTGIAALRLLRHRADEAGKRLTVVHREMFPASRHATLTPAEILRRSSTG